MIRSLLLPQHSIIEDGSSLGTRESASPGCYDSTAQTYSFIHATYQNIHPKDRRRQTEIKGTQAKGYQSIKESSVGVGTERDEEYFGDQDWIGSEGQGQGE